MNLIQARKAVDYFNTVKTQAHKTVYVGFIKDVQDIAKYGHFSVSIKDERTNEICCYYVLNHRAYKSIHEEVKTDFDKVYCIDGHIFYTK